MTVTSDTGDCFIVAFRVGMSIPGALIVHGLPLGTGGEAQGRRFWHAWVEDRGMVIDRSNGHDIFLPASVYYAAGQIDRTWKYTHEQVREIIEQTEAATAGPWVENWEQVNAL